MEKQKVEFARAREAMVTRHLESRGIRDRRVLAAMESVPREEFVPTELRDRAYADCALPIDCAQTISQPYTVAFMCEAAQIQPTDRVLEIGTGSGYGAAVLSHLAHEVHTIERHALLAEQAAERLQRLGYQNVTVHIGDGTLGLPDALPFDVIVVTAAAPELPSDYPNQLSQRGRIIIPIGRSRQHQTMYRYVLSDDKLASVSLGTFAFVPLVGVDSWPDSAP